MANASLWLYRTLLGALLPVAVPALKVEQLLTGKNRPRFRDRMARSLPALGTGGIWIQAVSVGEVEIARRVIGELARQGETVPVLLTATTATGLDLARGTVDEKVTVLPCPLDLPGPMNRVFEAARPRLAVMIETELWPEMLYQAGRRQVPAAIVNARLSDGSFRKYRRLGFLLRSLLSPLELVLARSENDAERFRSLGVPDEKIEVTGNIKYDLEPDDRQLEWAEAVRDAAGDRPIVVAGSTMEGEENQILDAVATTGVNGALPFLVLAPRHPERFDAVARLVEDRGRVLGRRSAGQLPPGTDVFLIDTIGELSRAYGLATVAFVGGSLVPTGGHNPLEPAAWGVPVLSGPHVHNFREVYEEMTNAGGALLVGGGEELRSSLEKWLLQKDLATAAGAAGRRVVVSNRGATENSVRALRDLMEGV